MRKGGKRSLISKSKAEEFIEALEERTGGVPDCEFCGVNDWFMQESPYGLYTVSFDEDTIRFAPGVSPITAAITCQNCGNTKQFATHVIGVDLFGDKEDDE